VRRIPRSRASGSSDPPDAFTAALVLLGQRELSEAQLRTRLARRGCDPDAIDQALDRLKRDRTLDDGRVARAAARLEAGVRRRGPARVRQRLQAMGLAPDLIQQAVAEAFEEVDESALLDAALERRLRGRALADLDDKGRARLVRGLVGQGFALGAVLKKIRD
jgi:regulatory protein